MTETDFIRYLAAKKSVDDRALNRRVWDTTVETAGALRRDEVPAGPRVIELGGGIGTMVERATRDGRLQPASWTLLDSSAGLLREAKRRLSGSVPFPVDYVEATVDAFLETPRRTFDLTVANAVLDLLDLSRVLPRLSVSGCTLFYFSINFDGVTVLEPEIDADLDARVISLYHRTMDERVNDGRPSGDSRCGRHLLTILPRNGFRIVEAGSSDWIVHPHNGSYDADERFFLSCILGFFEQSLSERREMEGRDLSRWLQERRRQLDAGELVFIAHQIDVLAETASS